MKWDKWILENLPLNKRTVLIFALCSVFVSYIVKLHSDFIQWRTKMRVKSGGSPQVCMLKQIVRGELGVDISINEGNGMPVDFIIKTSFSDVDKERQLFALLDRYKLAGKSYAYENAEIKILSLWSSFTCERAEIDSRWISFICEKLNGQSAWSGFTCERAEISSRWSSFICERSEIGSHWTSFICEKLNAESTWNDFICEKGGYPDNIISVWYSPPFAYMNMEVAPASKIKVEFSNENGDKYSLNLNPDLHGEVGLNWDAKYNTPPTKATVTPEEDRKYKYVIEWRK